MFAHILDSYLEDGSPRDFLDDVRLVMRFTRIWIHYGWLAHVFVCVLMAAAQGLAR